MHKTIRLQSQNMARTGTVIYRVGQRNPPGRSKTTRSGVCIPYLYPGFHAKTRVSGQNPGFHLQFPGFHAKNRGFAIIFGFSLFSPAIYDFYDLKPNIWTFIINFNGI